MTDYKHESDAEKLLKSLMISIAAEPGETAGAFVRSVVESVQMRGFAHIKPGRIDEGPALAQASFRYVSVYHLISRIAELTGATWSVTPYGVVHFEMRAQQ